MKKALCLFLCALLTIFSLLGCQNPTPADPTDTPTGTPTDTPTATPTQSPVETVPCTISEKDLRDKIAGSWVAQMIGVTWGASTEFRYQSTIIPKAEVPTWKASMVNDAFGQDDLYVEIPFLDTLRKKGIDATLEDFAKSFSDSKFGLAHANLIGRQNLRNGVAAADAGNYLYNYHADDIDWQIEADFLGNIYPGMINEAASRAFEIGHLMNYGDGVYGGVYVSAMHAAALTCDNLRDVLNAGIESIPEGTKFRAVLEDVEDSYENGDTWEECWHKIEDTWGSADKCPECNGTMNIDAKINAAYVHIGLLWGEGDFKETMEISMRCGQDSDCNPSTSAAILGTLYGLSGLPEEYKSAVDYSANKFAYTDYTLTNCIDVSVALAKKILTAAGAVLENGVYTYEVAKDIVPVPFEQWPDDELTIYLQSTVRAEGNVSFSLFYVLPTETDTEDITVSFDMGDGTVIPAAINTYTYLAPGTYNVSCTVSAGGKTSKVTQKIQVDFSPEGRGFKMTPSCSVSSPVGGGSRDISVITDGVIPKSEEDLTAQYDTFGPKLGTSDWFALQFDHKVTITDVVFTEGAHFGDGGWFKKTPEIEVLVSGKWQKANVSISPLYIEVDDRNAQNAAMETFTFTLDTPTVCEGVRVIGTPGGTSTFVSCSELDVKFSAVENPTYDDTEEIEFKDRIIPYVSESSPTGAGNHDISVMKDGVVPKAGASHATVQYDTFKGRGDEHEEFFGYFFRGTYDVTEVAYTAGATFNNGGWFKDGTLHLEALIDGEWVDVDTAISPNYPNSNVQSAFTAYRTYTFTLSEPLSCSGIRVIGMAGGSAHFTSVAELSVTVDK